MVSLMVEFLWRAGRSAILGCVDSQYEQIRIYSFWYCTNIPHPISNTFSHPSRGLSHGSGLQKCEARAVGHRKPCGGFLELGLRRLGLGWPAAFRPGRHITTSICVVNDEKYGLRCVSMIEIKIRNASSSGAKSRSWPTMSVNPGGKSVGLTA